MLLIFYTLFIHFKYKNIFSIAYHVPGGIHDTARQIRGFRSAPGTASMTVYRQRASCL